VALSGDRRHRSGGHLHAILSLQRGDVGGAVGDRHRRVRGAESLAGAVRLVAMDFRTFESRAHDLFAQVPERFLEGIDGLEVSRRAEAHPSLPDIYTLGECLTEQYPSEFGGAGDVRSIVVL